MDYAAAMEGSLKLKEISYIHSEAYRRRGAQARDHRPQSTKSGWWWRSAARRPLFGKMMSNVQEVKARGARVLAVAPEGDRRIFAEADDVLFAPRGEELFAAAPELVPLQLFAYYVALENGWRHR